MNEKMESIIFGGPGGGGGGGRGGGLYRCYNRKTGIHSSVSLLRTLSLGRP